MPKHRLSLAPAEWPPQLRSRLEAAVIAKDQRPRCEQGLGRWLLACRDEGTPVDEVTQDLWRARSRGIRPELRDGMRQALAIVFPKHRASLYARRSNPAPRPDPRLELARMIERSLLRFPEPWREPATRLMHVDPDGLADGVLIQAWTTATLKRRLEAAAHHFDICRGAGLEPDITRDSVRWDLRQRQKLCTSGDRRIGGAAAHVDNLYCIAKALHRARDWSWLRVAKDNLKKAARHHPSRNAGRVVDAREFRKAGEAMLSKALSDHKAADDIRALRAAHITARTALAMIFLSEAPIRLRTLVGLELETDLLANLQMVILSASQTKEKASDARGLSALLVRALHQYLEVHRPVVAPPGEMKLFVGTTGKPLAGSVLSNDLGNAGMSVFGVRTTPHSLRHSVATYIVATAPEEAALATVILKHKRKEITQVYERRADQISASRRLGAATRAAAESVGASLAKSPKRAVRAKTVRSLRADLAARAATNKGLNVPRTGRRSEPPDPARSPGE